MSDGMAASVRSESTEAEPRRMGKRHMLAVMVLLVVAVGVRLPKIGQSMWVDEMASVGFASHSLSGFCDNIAQRDTHPPLYYLLLHFWIKLGTSDVWVRLLSLVIGIAVVGVACAIGWTIGGAEWGLASGALAALSPGLVWPSQEARNYILMTFWAGAALLFLVRGLRQMGSWANWVLFGFCEGLSLLSFYYAAFFIVGANAALCGCCLVGKIRQQLLGKWLLSGILALVVFAWWMPSFVAQASMVGAAKEFVPLSDIVRRIAWEASDVDPFSVINWTLQSIHFPWPSIATCLVMAALFVLAVCRRSPDSEHGWVQGVWFCVLAMVLATAVVGAPLLGWLKGLFVSGRYFVFLDLIGILLFVSLIGAVIRRRKQRQLAYVVTCLALGAWLPTQGYHTKEPWREAATFVDSKVQQGDCLIGLAGDIEAYAHYGKSEAPRYNLPRDVPGIARRSGTHDWIGGLSEADMPAVGDLLKRYRRVIAVWSHTSRKGVDRGETLLRTWFEENGYRVVEAVSYEGGRGVRVEIFERRNVNPTPVGAAYPRETEVAPKGRTDPRG